MELLIIHGVSSALVIILTIVALKTGKQAREFVMENITGILLVTLVPVLNTILVILLIKKLIKDGTEKK